MKKVALVLVSVLLAATAFAFEFKHPNLRDAHQAAEAAIHHIEMAQQANKGVEFGGHAERAIELLRQAQHELAEAERYRDTHGR